jgi:spermidine synthase
LNSNHNTDTSLSWQSTNSIQNTVAITCFFLSGFAGLVYEVAWMRKASLIFGSTTFAVSTVLAVFFLGLAVGSYLFGRIAQATMRPLRIYALIEFVLGGLALASPYAFDLADNLYGGIYRAFADHTVLLLGSRFILVSLVVLPPTILMGGTLPLFCRQYVTSDSRIASSVGVLYSVNTLGAALGCVAAGLVLLPIVGLHITVWIGAALNILCGIAVASLRTIEAPSTVTSHGKTQSPTGSPVLISLLFFSVGFVALGGEVLWTRYLGLLIYNTVYTYTLTLAVVLVGIVLGSILSSRFFDKSTTRARHFGTLQVLTGLAVLTLMTLPKHVWQGFEGELGLYFFLLLPAAILSGASFPLAVRMVVKDTSTASIGTGWMAAINTLGGIFGALVVGFLCLPAFGLKISLLLITGVSLATGFAAWLWLDRNLSLLFRGTAIVISLLIWIGILLGTGTRIPADFLGERGSLVAFREGVGSNLAIIRDKGLLTLEIDRLWQGENRKNQQVMAAHIPMLFHPNPRSVLVVGVGTGQTASRFLMYDIARLECVDIEPTIFEFIQEHFDSAWMDDGRVALIPEDGRNYLQHSNAKHDVISLEVGQIFRPGVAFFYTTDFYRRVRERLNPGGVLAQFVPSLFFTTDQLRSVLRTFLDIFPQSALWFNSSEFLLIGVNSEKIKLHSIALERVSSNNRVHQDLSYGYWEGPQNWLNRPPILLAGHLIGPRGLDELAGNARLYRDDLPVLDYATRLVHKTEQNEIPLLNELRKHFEPVAAIADFELSPDVTSRIEEMREKNLGGLTASALVRQAKALNPSKDYKQITQLLSKAVRANRENFDANRMLGDALMFQGKYKETIQHYEGALRLRPNHAETHNNLGFALGQRGNFIGALRHFKEAVRLRPNYTDAKRNLARVRAILKSPPQR